MRRYRAGGSPNALLRAIDRWGEDLERELHLRLAEDWEEFRRLVDRLERLHGHIATCQAQARWLRRFPAGRSSDPKPIGCRLRNGAVVSAPELLRLLRRRACARGAA